MNRVCFSANWDIGPLSVHANRDGATEKKVSSRVEALAHFPTPPESRRYEFWCFCVFLYFCFPLESEIGIGFEGIKPKFPTAFFVGCTNANNLYNPFDRFHAGINSEQSVKESFEKKSFALTFLGNGKRLSNFRIEVC